jgi:hypothetical protein
VGVGTFVQSLFALTYTGMLLMLLQAPLVMAAAATPAADAHADAAGALATAAAG